MNIATSLDIKTELDLQLRAAGAAQNMEEKETIGLCWKGSLQEKA